MMPLIILIATFIICDGISTISSQLTTIWEKLCQIEKNQHQTNQKPNSK
jgi:hypothetical protein